MGTEGHWCLFSLDMKDAAMCVTTDFLIYVDLACLPGCISSSNINTKLLPSSNNFKFVSVRRSASQGYGFFVVGYDYNAWPKN